MCVKTAPETTGVADFCLKIRTWDSKIPVNPMLRLKICKSLCASFSAVKSSQLAPLSELANFASNSSLARTLRALLNTYSTHFRCEKVHEAASSASNTECLATSRAADDLISLLAWGETTGLWHSMLHLISLTVVGKVIGGGTFGTTVHFSSSFIVWFCSQVL